MVLDDEGRTEPVTRDARKERDADPDTERKIAAATEALQRRIARDLHDGLGQLLIGAAFSARELRERAPDSLHSPIERLVELLNEAARRVQSISRGLAPVGLAELPLSAALRGFALLTDAPDGVECAVDVTPALERLPATETAQIHLIAQEALLNAVRHGRATQIRVELRADGERRILTIADNGSGIRGAPTPGLGVESMTARARSLGGTLTLERREAGGILVRCVWPASG